MKTQANSIHLSAKNKMGAHGGETAEKGGKRPATPEKKKEEQAEAQFPISGTYS